MRGASLADESVYVAHRTDLLLQGPVQLRGLLRMPRVEGGKTPQRPLAACPPRAASGTVTSGDQGAHFASAPPRCQAIHPTAPGEPTTKPRVVSRRHWAGSVELRYFLLGDGARLSQTRRSAEAVSNRSGQSIVMVLPQPLAERLVPYVRKDQRVAQAPR
jgi:hypothetical protein